MKIALFILSAILILGSIPLAVFVEAKSGNVTGAGWTVPFWPFVLLIGVVLNPYVHSLVRFYLQSKVDIAKAENPVPVVSNAMRESKPSVPPSVPPRPTDSEQA